MTGKLKYEIIYPIEGDRLVMVEILRNPVWEGIAGIISVVMLIYFFVDRYDLAKDKNWYTKIVRPVAFVLSGSSLALFFIMIGAGLGFLIGYFRHDGSALSFLPYINQYNFGEVSVTFNGIPLLVQFMSLGIFLGWPASLYIYWKAGRQINFEFWSLDEKVPFGNELEFFQAITFSMPLLIIIFLIFA